MDKLNTAIGMISKLAAEQRQAGEVPSFLGVRGMLALMYDRIRAFSKEGEDHTEYVLDLAVKAVFALVECIPTVDFDIEDEPREEEVSDGMENTVEKVEDNGRWTPVAPGDTLPGVISDDDA